MVGSNNCIGRTRLNYPQGERIINIIGRWVKADEDASLGREADSNQQKVEDDIHGTC